MRQREMVGTSEIMIVQYNVVADALSKKSSSLVASLQLIQKPLLANIQILELEIVPQGDYDYLVL